jgi:signal transduction histidine kinase
MEPLRVLVADDEPGMRAGVVRTLRGFTVRVPDVDGQVSFTLEQAETGERALEIINAGPPDILLLDHKMPGISGLDVLDHVAGLDTDMLTIMITAYASIETAVTATKRGAYDFLAKPFTPDELKATVRKAAARLILAKQARQLAEEKRQVRFQFIRVLGHELKAPLAAIEGYLDLLKQRTLGDNVQSYGEVVDRSLLRVEGMRKLIADLLDVTRIESGLKSRQLAPVDVADIARSCIETLHSEAVAHAIRVELHAGGAVPMTADRGEIEMILANLLSNSIKYNCDGGRADLTLTRDAGRVTIRMADTGIGMTPDELKRLFGEFSRIRNEKTAHILGSGLGLSIVKKLAALYGGEPAVESTPGTGTTVSVVLVDGSPPAVLGEELD